MLLNKNKYNIFVRDPQRTGRQKEGRADETQYIVEYECFYLWERIHFVIIIKEPEPSCPRPRNQ